MMTFYTANMFFGSEDVARRRHFKDTSSMNNKIIENWNSIITPDDKVYILGGVGEFEFLLSLNGEKSLFVTRYEIPFFEKYISSITDEDDEVLNKEMFETYIRNVFYVSKTLYQKSVIYKDYSGNLVLLSTDKTRIESSKSEFIVAGGIGDYQRMFRNGINADIYVNGLFPISEVDVQDSIHHVNELIL